MSNSVLFLIDDDERWWKMARIISIVNKKGGTGKSACTANLAWGLAQKNMKLLIVDADPQSDVSAVFGYRDCDDSNETCLLYTSLIMHRIFCR